MCCFFRSRQDEKIVVKSTVKDRKILFHNRRFRLFVRLYNVDSYFKPYQSILPDIKQGFFDMGGGINSSIFPTYEK